MPRLSFQGPRLFEQVAPGAGEEEIWLGEVTDCTSDLSQENLKENSRKSEITGINGYIFYFYVHTVYFYSLLFICTNKRIYIYIHIY